MSGSDGRLFPDSPNFSWNVSIGVFCSSFGYLFDIAAARSSREC